MKRVELRSEVIKNVSVVAEIQCDMCNKVCPSPENGDWSADNNIVSVFTDFQVDKVYDGDAVWFELELCPECMEWLRNSILSGKIKRSENRSALCLEKQE